MKRGFILFMIVLGLAAFMDVSAAGKKDKKKVQAEKTEKLSKYDKLFKNKKVDTKKGFLTLHMVDGKIYFEMPVALLGREFLLGSKIVETSDMGSGIVGLMGSAPKHFTFMLQDSMLMMREVSRNGQVPLYSDSKEDGVQEAIRINSIHPIIKSFPVMAYNADSTAVVFDMTDFLVGHDEDMTPFCYGKRAQEYGRAGQYVNFKKELSYLVSTKAFDDNVSIVSCLGYWFDLVLGGQYVISKDEPLTAKVNRTFMLLPEEPAMRPRLADPRIGIATSVRENITTKVDRSVETHYMERWNLQPSDVEAYKQGKLTEPTQPIVFYLDPNFPRAWRTYIAEGVCDWNKAFEAIGFKNAIQVKEYPTDDAEFDPDNMKYNTIRYVPSGVVTMMRDASWVDPRSGEIKNASLFLFHDLLKWNNIQRFVQTSQVDEGARHLKLSDELQGESIRAAVRHEIGHALGLTNNMAGSAAIPTDSLRSASFTREYGITASVMDNVGFNYVAQPEDKGVALDPKLGTYDYYAIKVAYQPVFEAATPEEEYKVVSGWISEKAGDPMYRFAPEQYLLTTFDPSGLAYDLGDDAIKASGYGIKNLQYIMEHMDEWMDGEDVDFSYRNDMYRFIVAQLKGYLFNVYRNIGSFYLNEAFVGDPNPVLTVVPKDIQRASLKFVIAQLKDLDWLDKEEVIKNLSFNGSQAMKILRLYVVKEKNVITDLYQTKRISLTYHRDPQSYSPKEYIEDLYELVFKPTMEGRALTDAERVMQAEFISNVRNDVDINGRTRWYGQYYLQDRDVNAGLDENPEDEEEAAAALENRIFGHRWVVENIAADNQKHLWYSVYDKIKELIKKQRLTGDAATRAHYDYLLFLMARSWKDVPKI